VDGGPDRVTADEPEVASSGCSHIDQLRRLDRDLVAERGESHFEEAAAGVEVADVDLDVIEHGCRAYSGLFQLYDVLVDVTRKPAPT
jgi:hypothetical protein